jgi:hypothetical protein
MILGVEHVALSCADIERGAADLADYGFSTAFIERDLPNAPAKTPLLHTYAPRHDIASCRARTGIAVELTAHGGIPAPAVSGYDVRFAGDGSGLVSLRVRSACVEDSKAFWCGAMRFRVLRGELAGTGDAAMAISSPVGAWALELHVEAGPKRPRTMLDDAGFPCLALITNRLEEDLRAACEHGGHETVGPFDAAVHGRALRIALLRGPGDELIELIEFLRDR